MSGEAGPRPICGTCGSDFECFDGTPPAGCDRFGWYDCERMCPVCFAPLGDGPGVMEHPGLGARIHLLCCPAPAEPDDDGPRFVALRSGSGLVARR